MHPSLLEVVRDCVALFMMLVGWPMMLVALVIRTFDLKVVGHGICEECGGMVDHSLGCSEEKDDERKRG